jgi:hypothetical protein
MNKPPLVLLCVGHAQIKRQKIPTLDLGTINNVQHLSSTTTTIPSNNGDAAPSDGVNTQHCHHPK